MSDKAENSGKDAAKRARDERLAEALRANLRRRKAAARSRPESPPEPPGREGDDPGRERK